MKNKSTSIELLRIILTLFIPIYHWLLYNGIFYADNAANNLYAMIPFAGLPFSCLYAFITMSSFFLLKKKYRWNIRKIYSFLALALTLWVFKTIVIHALFPGYKMNYYVDTFFLKGAWWYVYPYILLMIFYPLLNHFIYTSSKRKLYLFTVILGVLFIIAGITNRTNFFNDTIMFLFIYFFIGCLQRNDNILGIKYQKQILIGLYFISMFSFTMISIYLKHPANSIALNIENEILQRFHTRYNMFGFISGIALFYIVKDIKIPYIPAIHQFSKITLWIFLLHETVMSVFWAFEIKSCEFLSYLPTIEFFDYIFIYMVFCVLGATVLYMFYHNFIAPIWDKLIHKLCETRLSKRITDYYKKFEVN